MSNNFNDLIKEAKEAQTRKTLKYIERLGRNRLEEVDHPNISPKIRKSAKKDFSKLLKTIHSRSKAVN